MATRVNNDDIRDVAVDSAKLALDSDSLYQVTGGMMEANDPVIKLSAFLTDQHEHDVFLTYQDEVVKTVTYKDKTGNVMCTVTINRNATTYLIESVVETIGPKTITHTIARDENSRITSVAKVVS